MRWNDMEWRREQAGQWYDLCTAGRGSPERREAYIRTALSLRHSGRPEPPPRPLSQASLYSQPERKRKRAYRAKIAEAKARAAAPLRRSARQQQPEGLPLFGVDDE